MSGRDPRGDRERERERDRERDRRAQASARTNEYFVPKDGIDREVITADICRYLGNDALVRPGNYENPQTRQAQQGYFITAYRNLTTAMIADLKADSERWDAERRATTASGARSSTVDYRTSQIHQSRQYYGPTEATPAPVQQYPPVSGAGPQGVYGDTSSQPYYSQPTTGNYVQPQQGYGIQPQDNSYYAGADYRADMSGDPRLAGRVPVSQPGGTIPRTTNVQYAGQAPVYPSTDSRANPGYGYATQSAQVASTPYGQQQPTDPYYGRAGAQDPYEQYDNRGQYQDTSAYSSQPMVAPSTTSTTVSSTSTRHSRDRESDRDRHHRSDRNNRNR